MNKRQKEVQAVQLNDEQRTIRELKQVYKKASEDCAEKIRQLSTRTDLENLQTIIYQRQYQEALKKQIDGVLDTLNGQTFTTIALYLEKSYDNGFFGTLYDLQGQGIPLVYPIDQEQVVAALQTDSRISQGLYNRMGEDAKHLKNSIRAELSRGITNGESWNGVAKKIALGMNSPFDKAYHRTCTIARTEGHRVQQEATHHCQQKAKSKGADVVKQWDSTLDGNTRPWHMDADGQIAEIDQPFEVMGEQLMYPSDPAGSARNVINCRCCSLQRAKWALSEEEYYTKWDGDKDELVRVQAKSYNEFREKADEITQQQQDRSNPALYPDNISGVRRNQQGFMTYDEADTGKVNPNYGTDRGYSINCQSCVVTFEARQRGYDVQVLSCKKGSMAERVAVHTNLPWIDPVTGKHPEYIVDETLTAAKQYLGFVDSTVKRGERYTIQFLWNGRSRSGHIVNLDRTESGELRIKDNQRGAGEISEYIGDEAALRYLSRMKYQTSVYGTKISCAPKLLRIDNMVFDESVINELMEAAK